MSDPATKQAMEIPTRRVKWFMVDPIHFMSFFTDGVVFRRYTKIAKGIPADAKLIGVAYDARMGGASGAIMMVIESKEFEEVPINVMPPAVQLEIQIGDPDATKKKKTPRKK